MKYFWRRISLLGIENREVKEYQKVRIVLANRMAFVSPFMAIPLIFMWNNFFPLSFIVIIFSLLLLLTLYFNYKGFFILSRLWISTLPSIVVLVSLSLFPEEEYNVIIGGRVLAFAMGLAPLFFFSLREKVYLIASLIITIISYFMWHVLAPILNIPDLKLTVPQEFFNAAVSFVAFLTIVLQFIFIEEYYDESEDRISKALKEAQEKTAELLASQEELEQKNQEMKEAYENLRAMQQELEEKNNFLETIKQELEQREKEAKIQQTITSKTKEYDDLARQLLDKNIHQLTDAFLSKLSSEFQIGKIILAVFYPTETPYILNGYGINRNIIGTQLQDSLLKDACINKQEWFLNLSERYNKNLIFIETGTAKIPAKAIWILPITYQNIVIAGLELSFWKIPDQLTIQTIKSIVNSFATVLFYKLEREKLQTQ